MPLEIVFLEPQNWHPLKPHYKSPITAFTVFWGACREGELVFFFVL